MTDGSMMERTSLISNYRLTSRFIINVILTLVLTYLSYSTLSSIILNARPIADDYGHVTYFSSVQITEYALGFYTGIDSHPLSVVISTLANLLLSSIGLVPGYAILATIQTLLFLILTSFLISNLVQFNRIKSSKIMFFLISALLLMLTLDFPGSTTESPYRAYALIGWANFFWQHVPLNLVQVLLFLRWRRNLWIKKDTTSLFLVSIMAIWGPLEGLTTLGMLIFVTLLQFKEMKFSMFKIKRLEFYSSYIILFAASLFTFFSPSATSRRLQYSDEVRIGHWYERFMAYNLLSFREIVVFGLFAATLSGLIGFIFGYKRLIHTNKMSFWNLVICLVCLVLCINFIETFSYFAPFHHTIFSFLFVISAFVGGVERGMKITHLQVRVRVLLISIFLFSVVAFFAPASSKAFNYRQIWDSNQRLIISKCADNVHIPGISRFLPGSSMNPDWNEWSCKNRKWFDGISTSVKFHETEYSRASARVLSVAFDRFINHVIKFFYIGHSAGSSIIKKFNYYNY